MGIDIGIFRYYAHYPLPEGWYNDPENTLIVLSPDELIEAFEKLDLLGARGIIRFMQEPSVPGTNSYNADALIPVVQSESDRIRVFTPSPTRWALQNLLNNVSALFAPRIFASLHDVAQYDFSEAGKCIAFDLPTSAVFHLMRGTERVLRDFYLCKTNKDARNVDWKDMSWGVVLNDLRKTENPSLGPLYDHLKNIKDNFRNPSQHPDKIYTIDKAQDLFGVCIDVVDQIESALQYSYVHPNRVRPTALYLFQHPARVCRLRARAHRTRIAKWGAVYPLATPDLDDAVRHV